MSSILQEGVWLWAERVDHSAAVAMMMQAAVLLANVPGERAAHWVPGKLYEYLAAGRPILFIGPQGGDAARIVSATRTGIVVPEDEERIHEALVALHQAWSRGERLSEPDWSAISAFDRSTQAARLVTVFDEMTEVGTRASDPFEPQGSTG
jgi:glycosyltransferase involved in cell wall biosynthesis